MKRLVVEIDVIVHDVIVHLAGLIVVVIMLVMMIQVVRHELAVTVHLSRNDQMGFVESVGINSWNLSMEKTLMGEFYCVEFCFEGIPDYVVADFSSVNALAINPAYPNRGNL